MGWDGMGSPVQQRVSDACSDTEVQDVKMALIRQLISSKTGLT